MTLATPNSHKEVTLITLLSRCVNTIGYEATLKHLEKAEKSIIQDEVISFVINEVCQATNTRFSEIKEQNYSRSEIRKVVLGFIIYFLNKSYGHSFPSIRIALNMKISPRMVNYHYDVIKNAKLKNPKSNIDYIISAKFNYLENAFIKHQKSLTDAK